MSPAILRAEGLSIGTAERTLVRDVDLTIERGEIVGMVGESGSGKTITALAIARLLPAQLRLDARRLELDGLDLRAAGRGVDRALATRLSVVFQDPMSSLNPALRIGTQITEATLAHTDATRRSAEARALDRLRAVAVGAPATRLRQFPHALSGGTRQRVMIAMASMLAPVLLVADEPTTALDVTVQAQVMRLLREINANGTAILLISHNIVLLSDVCDRIVVMYAGRVVESLPASALLSPRHPYTELLIAAVPDMDRPPGVSLETIPGSPADAPDDGCPFAPRCPLAVPQCRDAHPPTTLVAAGHEVACWVRGGAVPEATT